MSQANASCDFTNTASDTSEDDRSDMETEDMSNAATLQQDGIDEEGSEMEVDNIEAIRPGASSVVEGIRENSTL
jgi:hypothetical protein